MRRITPMGGIRMWRDGDFAEFGRGLSVRDGPARSDALFSAWRAGVLSFASPKESSQRKGDPWVGAPAGFLALLGGPGGLPELACGSNKASRNLPAHLRCSAPRKGPKDVMAQPVRPEMALLRSTEKKA